MTLDTSTRRDPSLSSMPLDDAGKLDAPGSAPNSRRLDLLDAINTVSIDHRPSTIGGTSFSRPTAAPTSPRLLDHVVVARRTAQAWRVHDAADDEPLDLEARRRSLDSEDNTLAG